MITNDINPFIRYAFITERMPQNRFVINADSRLFYVVCGKGEIIIEDKTYPFEKDFLCIFRSGTKYCWKFDADFEVRLAVVNFDYTQSFRKNNEQMSLILPDSDNLKNIIPFSEFEDIQILNTPICLNNAHLFKKNALELINMYESAIPLSKEFAETKLKELILQTVHHISFNSKTNTKLLPILEYISQNFDKDISNNDLASIASYHPYHLNLLMKQQLGMTLHSYITQIRMNEALKLLSNTNKSIETISIECGYKNATHFYKIFKKNYGISPSEYRKNTILI